MSLLVAVGGHVVFEDYPHAGALDRAHDIASGTKSFAGLLAVVAAADGFLHLDERVVETLPEWRGHPRKERITLRQLLQLVSGIEAGGKPGQSPDYAAALHTRAVADPGEKFLYGPAPFQIFGEMLRRKLGALVADPLVYLHARVLDRVGLQVRRWRRGHDGFPNFSSGAVLTAREWAKLGELVRQHGQWHGAEVVPGSWLDECFRGTPDHPAYGLTWWLNAPLADTDRVRLRSESMGLEDLSREPCVPRDLVYAAGAAKQRLYVSRSQNLVVVRQATGLNEALATGEHGGFSDREFLRLLLGRVPTP